MFYKLHCLLSLVIGCLHVAWLSIAVLHNFLEDAVRFTNLKVCLQDLNITRTLKHL